MLLITLRYVCSLGKQEVEDAVCSVMALSIIGLTARGLCPEKEQAY